LSSRVRATLISVERFECICVVSKFAQRALCLRVVAQDHRDRIVASRQLTRARSYRFVFLVR
jgi:hypothetical protein